MFKIIALSLAFLCVPILSGAVSPTPVPTKQSVTKVKKVKHAHAQEVWVCNVFQKDSGSGHVCTFKSGKKGKCAWCGQRLVKAGSKEDLKRQAQAPKK